LKTSSTSEQRRRDSKPNRSGGSGARVTRRHFVSACAACSATSLLNGINAWAAEPTRKPKIRLVFGETRNDQPIWPNIGYDFDTRRKQVTDLLTKSLPDLEFLSVRLMDDPEQTDEVLAQDAAVDGYLVCVQGLGWNNNILKLCSTRKPTLLVDNLFGGSGLFLRDIAKILSSGKPVNWVSSSNDQDLVRSAQHFTGLAQGKTGAETAAAFGATRRNNTPPVADWSCKDDPVGTVDIDKGLQQLQQTRILVVGGGWGGDEFRKASKEVTGVEFIPISFEEMAAAYAQADPKHARAYGEQWTNRAQKIIDTRPEDIEKSGAMYVGMKQLLDKHGARGISINCLGGFYGGHLKAYPCLGFCQLNDDGLVGGCEADQMSALTMAIMGVLAGRPGFISDPVIDTSRNVIIYAHCVAMTKPFGRQGEANPYQILTHSEDRQGASMRSLLPAGYMTTTLEINPTNRQVLIHRAKTVGNNPSDMACRTKLEAVVKGDLEKLTEHWSMGWHRVTFYGDLKPQVEQLCQRLELQLVEEA
jgi:hypothetical protein